MLLGVVCRVRDSYVYDLAILLNKGVLWVNETAVRLDAEGVVALANLLVELWLYGHTVVLNKCLTCLVVTLDLDALNLVEHLTEELAKSVVVVYNDVLLAILLNPLNYVILLALFVAPLCNHLTVTHMRLLNILAELDA